MRSFPATLTPQRRLRYGIVGVVALLLVWWALTLPVFEEQVTHMERVATGTFDTGRDPRTGEEVRVERFDVVPRVETVRRALVNPPALATPTDTARRAWGLLTADRPNQPSLLAHVGRSTTRILLGFALSALIGVPLGVAMGLFPVLRAMLSPIVSFLRPLPSISWVPLTMIWLGADEKQKVAIVFLGTFSAALIYTVEATLRVHPDLIKAARNLGASENQVLWRVLLPAALPNIVSGLKVVMAIGWTCVISAEIVGSQEGLGALIWTSKETADTAAVFVGMASISVIVLLLDALFGLVERQLLPYLFLRETGR